MVELKKLIEHRHQVTNKGVIGPVWNVGLVILGLAVTVFLYSGKIWAAIPLFIVACYFFERGFRYFDLFAKTDPSLLRSEEHELRRKVLEMLGDKDKNYDPNDLITITNPYDKTLPESMPDEKKTTTSSHKDLPEPLPTKTEKE